MANLFKLEHGKMSAFLGQLAQAGLTAEMADQVQGDKTGDLAEIMVEALKSHLHLLRPLEENEYRVSVDYPMPIDVERLVKRVSNKREGSELFLSDSAWGHHSSCIKSHLQPGDRIMLLCRNDAGWQDDDVMIADMSDRGYRPGTIVDLRAWLGKHPLIKTNLEIVGIGSMHGDPDDLGYPVLRCDANTGPNQLNRHYVSVDDDPNTTRFLFVRKDA